MSHITYHVVLLWNCAVGDWLSVDTWLGTCCAPGARMRAHGLVYPLFVAETTWFGLPDVARKESGQDMVLNAIKYVMALMYRWA